MTEIIEPGTIRVIEGVKRVNYEGYWIKMYDVPEDTLLAKKRLIQALTRRLFNHTEHGLNVPGNRLAEAKASYEAETDPDKQRVKGAMYAGALFNRATDIFTKVVELQAMGVEILHNNELMRECGRCLQEALSLCRLVLHRSGEEGIDELWGEPFRVFSIPVEDFYNSRYLKIGQSMRDIDRLADAMIATFEPLPLFSGLGPIIREFSETAKVKAEILRTDPDIFDVWATMVTAGERLANFKPVLPADASEQMKRQASSGNQLICNGRDLITYISRARVTMPKSVQEYIERCDTFTRTGVVEVMPIPLPG